MDVLSNVLQSVRLNGAVFFDVRACDPVVAETPNMKLIGHRVMPGASHVIPFHIMLRGSCWVEDTESPQPPVQFREGDVIFYPHGHGHIFVSNIGDRLEPDLDLYRRPGDSQLPIMMDLDDSGRSSMHFVCGYFACAESPFNPLLEALPLRVLSPRPENGNHIEVDLIHSALRERDAQRAGGEAVLSKLSELLFVRVLRRHIESLPEHSKGWLAGMRDDGVRRALQLMHGQPQAAWTLNGLAKESGLSRAVLSERFTSVIGHSPMRYLALWRMQLAAQYLRDTNIPLEEIASQVGYQSESAFIRAFRTIVGDPPGAWRRAQQRQA
ncbi:AraC family transcriptional regulator [Mangrovicoccus ximenensis]|uniref:AraC family transcriptional regulator n=1 Tax=Mangrovicoccus ximenensis TaxID=1911570 RepID=UPI00137506FF|nr:AraC family transcriptional regulator [Mangrovicoccus ximenensis]